MWLLCLLFPLSSAFDEIGFLKEYGYITKDTNAQVGSDGYSSALKLFQKIYGLEQTGHMNRHTANAMKEPRCSLADVEKPGIGRRKRQAPRWSKHRLGYAVTSWTQHLAPGTVERIIARAIDEWQKVSHFRFERSSSPDIRINFGRGQHNCTHAFREATLAHAFPPPHGGLHFNDVYRFSEIEISNYREISLLSVATHELGHVLGLPHNDDTASVMNPRELHRKGVITTKDIWYLNQLYNGQRHEHKLPPAAHPPTTTRPAVTPRPDPCHASPDAVGTIRGEYIVFKDEWMWRISSEGNILLQPEKISDILPQVNSSVDAAANIHGNLWLFSGQVVYVFTVGGRYLQLKHAPLSLTDLGLPPEMTAVRLAYNWHYFKPSAAVYVWGEHEYWRLNLEEMKVDSSYPRPIKRNWIHVPLRSQAAFSKDDELHFLVENEVYRMNTSDFRLTVSKGYPMPLDQFWYGCRTVSRVSRIERSDFLSSSTSLSFILSFLIFSAVALFIY